MARSIFYFIVAGLCEIGGGYLVWLTVRERRSAWLAAAGAVLLIAYGFVPTLQLSHFSRVYTAYGAVFIVLAMIWGIIFEGSKTDRFDVLGAVICLIGASVIMYAPRS